MNKKFKIGQSLIEVVVAMALLGIVAVALVATSLFTQKATRTASSQVQATKLGEESVEQMRIFRDRLGFGALTNGDCWKLVTTEAGNPNTWKLANSAPDVCPDVFTVGNTAFNRFIKIEDGVNASQKKITVTVTWTEGANTKSASSQTFLSNALGGLALLPSSPNPSTLPSGSPTPSAPPPAECYRDLDGDGYGFGPSYNCGSLPQAGWADKGGDCYDGNNKANPGIVLEWFYTSRGDGSFDYNCDGVTSYNEYRYNNAYVSGIDKLICVVGYGACPSFGLMACGQYFNIFQGSYPASIAPNVSCALPYETCGIFFGPQIGWGRIGCY